MAACIPRTKATKRVALSALMVWSGRALPGLADPHRALAGYRTIPARDDGGRRGESAPALGQPRDAQAITESGVHSTLFSSATSLLDRCERITRQSAGDEA